MKDKNTIFEQELTNVWNGFLECDLQDLAQSTNIPYDTLKGYKYNKTHPLNWKLSTYNEIKNYLDNQVSELKYSFLSTNKSLIFVNKSDTYDQTGIENYIEFLQTCAIEGIIKVNWDAKGNAKEDYLRVFDEILNPHVLGDSLRNFLENKKINKVHYLIGNWEYFIETYNHYVKPILNGKSFESFHEDLINNGSVLLIGYSNYKLQSNDNIHTLIDINNIHWDYDSDKNLFILSGVGSMMNHYSNKELHIKPSFTQFRLRYALLLEKYPNDVLLRSSYEITNNEMVNDYLIINTLDGLSMEYLSAKTGGAHIDFNYANEKTDNLIKKFLVEHPNFTSKYGLYTKKHEQLLVVYLRKLLTHLTNIYELYDELKKPL